MSQDKDIQAARVAFEAVYPVPAQCVWVGNGYAATGYNAWDAQTHCHRWEGWLAARRAEPEEERPSNGQVSAAARNIARLLLGDERKVDCDIVESHIRELLASPGRGGPEH
ncbi:hypothetical protein [Cupriavidus sp. 2SB]|uniref:hypothetical protein n=1 Tax=Cupriavidus sp. 2SB TaxID=2502199 RepID=UPI0010F4E873|nr:hypothetical protein [Cupriavidus sp. 2SB]